MKMRKKKKSVNENEKKSEKCPLFKKKLQKEVGRRRKSKGTKIK